MKRRSLATTQCAFELAYFALGDTLRGQKMYSDASPHSKRQRFSPPSARN